MVMVSDYRPLGIRIPWLTKGGYEHATSLMLNVALTPPALTPPATHYEPPTRYSSGRCWAFGMLGHIEDGARAVRWTHAGDDVVHGGNQSVGIRF